MEPEPAVDRAARGLQGCSGHRRGRLGVLQPFHSPAIRPSSSTVLPSSRGRRTGWEQTGRMIRAGPGGRTEGRLHLALAERGCCRHVVPVSRGVWATTAFPGMSRQLSTRCHLSGVPEEGTRCDSAPRPGFALGVTQHWCLSTPGSASLRPPHAGTQPCPPCPRIFTPPGSSVREQQSCHEANNSLWHSYLGVIVSRERQRVEHFQRAEDILLTLLESVHAREPRFLVDYARNLEALEFALCASEDAVTLEMPLRVDGNTLQVLACQTRDTPARHPSELNTCYLEVCSPGTDLEDWTGVVDVMEHGGGAVCLVPGKILQHLKELLVSAIVHCQRLFLLQPGDISAENLREDAMELSLLIRGSWKTIRFDIVPVVRRQQEPLRPQGWQSNGGFPEGSLRKATEEAHFVPASPHCWRSSTHLPILKLLRVVDTLKGPRLDSLRLLDQLRDQDWGGEGGQGSLTFNHLKMVLLWSTELFPSPEDWQNLEGSVYRLLVILLRCLATQHLPHFLNPEENLFQGAAPDLASIYHKVERFAWDPQRFLRFHFGLHACSGSWQADPDTRALLQLPTKDGSYWDTAYFDLLLSQFQVYRIQDSARRSAMSQLLSKIRQEIPQQS